MGFESITYRVPDRAAVLRFYRDLLGMQETTEGFGFAKGGAKLRFEEAGVGPHDASVQSAYWKVGITVPDLDHSVAYLRKMGQEVSEPRQFRDIGYLAHLRDPAGHVIELLQVGFEGNAGDPGPDHAVGGRAVLAHITLRVRDIDRAKAWCEDHMGLRLMSVQPVSDLGFTLYFYGWSDEILPTSDLMAVENREWLWGRPYTVLELQHLEDGAPLKTGLDDQAGPVSFAFAAPGKAGRFTLEDLALAGLF